MDEGEAIGLIEQVCASRGKKAPRDIVFRAGPHSYVTWGYGGRIILPRPSFVDHHMLVSDDCEIRLLILHETAHWLSGPSVGHKPIYYALLFELCSEYGVDMGYAKEDEFDYRPRYARLGWDLFVKQSKEEVWTS